MVSRKDLSLIFLSVVCCVVGQLLLKSGMETMGELTPAMMLSAGTIAKITANIYICI